MPIPPEEPRCESHATHRPHGSGVRGLSPGFADRPTPRFGPMFEFDGDERRAGRFEPDDLWSLAQALAAERDDPKDGADDEEGHVPAAYTYLGQFVDHDLTLDPATFAQTLADPAGHANLRTPRFDLDSVYGRGPADQPYLFDGVRLRTGDKLLIVGRNPAARDLPRTPPSEAGIRSAIVGDPRNDENVIVSQLHGMFLRFHNRVARENPAMAFEDVRRIVVWHYQWMVVRDFLPRIVEPGVLERISPALTDPTQPLDRIDLAHYGPQTPDLPIEFSVAAYRMGHSMVRAGYRLNEMTGPLAIFDPDNPTNGLNAFGEFPRSWGVDWQRFVDLGLGPTLATDADRVQLAYKIDTSMVEPLARLPKSVAGDEADRDRRLASLAYRNLLRGVHRGLPTGQAVAKAMGTDALPDDEIVLGSAMAGAETRTMAEFPAFKDRCPLWIYVLAEARRGFFGPSGEARLGPVGGGIVAETFLGLLGRDGDSFLSAPGWRPTLGRDGHFTLADLLRYALDL